MQATPPNQNYADPRSRSNTSDHTYQSTEAVFLTSNDQEIFRVSGSTWNLMNKCISKEDNMKNNNKPYKNNPWNYTENSTAYFARKKKQFDKILEIICSGRKDFMFLQEVDCLTSPTFFKDASDKATYQDLQRDFLQKLRAQGWDIRATQRGPGVKPLVTLYNTKTLKPTGNENSVLGGIAFECEFTHLGSKQNITLTNLHLEYGVDYSQTLPQYQRTLIGAGKFAIMGGDTNHSPNNEIVGLINNWNNATNLEGNDDTKAISDTHDPKTNHKKCYDCFLVNPTMTTRAVIMEQAGEVFKYDHLTKQFIVARLDPSKEYVNHYVHQTAPGQPWVRGGWDAYLQAKASAFPTSTTTKAAPIQANPPSQQNLFVRQPVNASNQQQLIIYRSKSGELAVKFPSEEMRNTALKYMGGTQTLPINTVAGFAGKECLFTIPIHKDVLYIPALDDKNQQQLACLFPSLALANKFRALIFGNNSQLTSCHNVYPTLYVKADLITQKNITIPVTSDLNQALQQSIRPKGPQQAYR